MEMENERKKLTFGNILIIISIVLLIICIFYWIQLSNFIDEFEKTLNVQSQTDIENSLLNFEKTTLNDQDILLDSIEDSEFFIDLTLEVATNYAKFTSADLEFDDIKDYFQKDSEILELLETYNSNRYNSHEDSYFENISISPPVLTQDDSVKCQVSFDYIVITSEDTHNYPSSYTLYFDIISKKVTSLEMN